jgi:hypothetical protein
MALAVEFAHKGATVSYHKLIRKIEDVATNKTTSFLASYTNQDTREADIAAYQTLTERQFDGVDLTRAELYALWKAPMPVEVVDTPAVIEGGVEITPAVTREVESNVFANATDC